MTNEYGERLDSNGYAETLLPSDGCWFCGYDGELARHEVFGGTGRRAKSKRLGLWVTVCPSCHTKVHSYPSSRNAMHLKKQAEIAADARYGWTEADFIAEFGENYL